MKQSWAGQNHSGTKLYGRQLIPVSMGPNERFGMDEELVHFGVHLSQGLDVFLDPVSTKRAGQNVGRTKGTWTTKRQGTTLGMYLTCIPQLNLPDSP